MKTRCESCGALLSPHATSCSYCGSPVIMPPRSASESDASSADSAIKLLMDNINSLRMLPRPENGFITILRIYLAFVTMGLSLLVWRRRENSFRIDSYRNHKGIIESNIALLRLRYRDSEAVVSQIRALEAEFARIEQDFSRQILTRRIILGITAALFVILIVHNKMKDDAATGLRVDIPLGEVLVMRRGTASRLHVLVTKMPNGAQHIYIANGRTGEKSTAFDSSGVTLEERNIVGIGFIGERRVEYYTRDNGRRIRHVIQRDDRTGKYIKEQ